MVAKMLKLLCVFFSVLTVLLCGCGKHHPVLLCADFKADFVAKYKGMSLSGQLTHTRQGVCSIDIRSPDTLRGLSLRSRSGELILSQGSAAATADEGYLPAGSFPSLMGEILGNIAAGRYTEREKNTFSQSLSCGECLFTADDSGVPLTVEATDAVLTVTFSNGEKIGGG